MMMMMIQFSDAVRLQNELAKKVVASDDFGGEIKRICGVDAAYDGNVAYCSVVVMDRKLNLLESANSKSVARHPYVPGLLMLREAEPIFNTLNRLKGGFDLLLVDGHGMLHPRKCGLACYVGVTLDRPTIGVAKSRLCGTVRDDGFVILEHSDQILGYAISKRLYVSVGHRISLGTAVAIVKEMSSKSGTPEPLRLADISSKMQKRRRRKGLVAS
jgi:deoxyribonuclease V